MRFDQFSLLGGPRLLFREASLAVMDEMQQRKDTANEARPLVLLGAKNRVPCQPSSSLQQTWLTPWADYGTFLPPILHEQTEGEEPASLW